MKWGRIPGVVSECYMMYETLITFLNITLKKESNPPTFCQVLLLAGARTWPLVLFLITSFLSSNSSTA